MAAPVAEPGSRSVCTTIVKPPAVCKGNRCLAATGGSKNAESAHQLLSRFHCLLRIHPAEHLFPAIPIHRCEFAHELVPSFPLCVFTPANAEREQSRQDPNRNVRRSDQKHLGNLQITLILCKGQHPGARFDIAFGCSIDGDQGSATRISPRSETPRRHGKRCLRHSD